MPFKHNAATRHRIPRARYRVQNWPTYEAGLRRRGDLTFWLDEAAQVPALLGQAEGAIASVTADGAYDGEPTYAAAAARQREPPPELVIPPCASAVPSTSEPAARSPRDRHVRLIAEQGRMAWQQATNYGRRNLGETTVGRYKHLIGPTLRARSLPGQQGEVALAVHTLNRMIRVAKPVSVRIVCTGCEIVELRAAFSSPHQRRATGDP